MRKYLASHSLLLYNTKATGRWVGRAHSKLKLSLQTVSTRITHNVIITIPSNPSNKKNTPSNIFNTVCPHCTLVNDNPAIATNKIINTTVGVNTVDACG